MTSTAPTPGRPTRPCTAELLAASELPATTAGTAVIGPKLPPFAGDDMLAGFDPAFAHLLTEASATHPAFGRAGSRHGRHPHHRW